MRIARFTDGKSTHFGRMTDDLLGVEVLSADPLVEGVNPTGQVVAVDRVRLLPPVVPSKIVGIGKNYVDHIKEFDSVTPEEPLIFLKPSTSLIGHGETIVLPAWTEHVDHEAELAVVIGAVAKNVPLERVDEVIYGYTVGNDVSARDIQKRDGQWTRAKGFDTACPLGPWIVPGQDLDIENLRVTATVNGETRQSESTARMINPVRRLVSFVSQAFTLLPGDVILTGTPAGVSRIDDGDVVEVSVSGIGTLSNPVARTY
ncbi:fumarylacetoacetate hydrolase family protein [Actinomycetaceae bacterium L2_0104]